MKFSVNLLLSLGCLLATLSGSSSESESEDATSSMSSSASDANETPLNDIITRLGVLEVPSQKDNENFGEYLKGIQKMLSTFELADLERDNTDSSEENLNQEAWSTASQNITKIKEEISALKEKAIAYNTGFWRNKYLRWVNGHYITDALKLHTEIMASVTAIEKRLGAFSQCISEMGDKSSESGDQNPSVNLVGDPGASTGVIENPDNSGDQNPSVNLVGDTGASTGVIEDPTGKKVSFIQRYKRSLVVMGVVIILVAGALTGAYFILGH